tara:strand:+ start:271 stop:666 length:396 start_codon:yes stop_codon:yes gene_type:complete
MKVLWKGIYPALTTKFKKDFTIDYEAFMTNVDFHINQRRVQGIKKSIASYFPSFQLSDFNQAEIWTGLRPCSPDGLPYIGRIKKLPNVLVATGHGLMGMSLGPITGKLIAELASDQSPRIEISSLALERFH